MDMNVVKMIEETAADEGALDKQLSIYDVCSTQKGRIYAEACCSLISDDIYQPLIRAKVLLKYSDVASTAMLPE